MITIVVRRQLKPGVKEAYIERVRPLVDGSRSEPGCISYDLVEENGNPDMVAFVERWKDEEALAYHQQTAHFTSIVPTLNEDFAAAPSSGISYKLLY